MPAVATINLHPSTNLISSLRSRTYDVICLGSGWAGRVLATVACKAGLTTLIVEDELVGGDCPFWACVPSKAILRPAEALEAARSVGGAREQITQDKTVDVEAVWRRRDMFTSQWDDTKALIPLVESSGADLVRGWGKIVGTKVVRIEATGQQAVAICTGSVIRCPDIPGLKEANPWGPRDATSASVVPEHLIVLGAGPVGCELATAYLGFGSKVTIVTKTQELLPIFDAEAGKAVREKLVSQGAAVYLSAQATEVRRTSDSIIEMTLGCGTTIPATQILLAAGRIPRTKDIGIETLGLRDDGSPIHVDDTMTVENVPGNWLYAVGDVNGRSPLTHMCKYQGTIAGNVIVARTNGQLKTSRYTSPWSPFSATADHVAIPSVVFTNPIVASVGLAPDQARAAGKVLREVRVPITTVGSKLHSDTLDGFAKWVIDDTSNTIVGATFVGRDVTDLLHASTVAIVGEVPLQRLRHAIPSFPTVSEVYLSLMEQAEL